jgi:hypothetical protein
MKWWEPPHLCGGRSASALRKRDSKVDLRFSAGHNQTRPRRPLAGEHKQTRPPTAQPQKSTARPQGRFCPPLCHPDRSEARWRDLRFPSATNNPPLRALPSPLSSRPKRSAVEGSAVQRTHPGNVFTDKKRVPRAFTPCSQSVLVSGHDFKSCRKGARANLGSSPCT